MRQPPGRRLRRHWASAYRLFQTGKSRQWGIQQKPSEDLSWREDPQKPVPGNTQPPWSAVPRRGDCKSQNTDETFCQKFPDWNESQHQANVTMQREGLCVWNNHRGTNLEFDPNIPVHDRLPFTLPCLRWWHQTHGIKPLVHGEDPHVLENWHGSVSSIPPQSCTCHLFMWSRNRWQFQTGLNQSLTATINNLNCSSANNTLKAIKPKCKSESLYWS